MLHASVKVSTSVIITCSLRVLASQYLLRNYITPMCHCWKSPITSTLIFRQTQKFSCDFPPLLPFFNSDQIKIFIERSMLIYIPHPPIANQSWTRSTKSHCQQWQKPERNNGTINLLHTHYQVPNDRAIEIHHIRRKG